MAREHHRDNDEWLLPTGPPNKNAAERERRKGPLGLVVDALLLIAFVAMLVYSVLQLL